MRIISNFSIKNSLILSIEQHHRWILPGKASNFAKQNCRYSKYDFSKVRFSKVAPFSWAFLLFCQKLVSTALSKSSMFEKQKSDSVFLNQILENTKLKNSYLLLVLPKHCFIWEGVFSKNWGKLLLPYFYCKGSY